MTSKKTTELVPGDVVLFGGMRDRILSVEKDKSGTPYKFHVERTFDDGRKEQPEKCFFFAGRKADHLVES